MQNKNHSDYSFMDAIDCNFPYNNERLSEYLIVHACIDLSIEAVLTVLYELMYPWKGQKITIDRLKYVQILSTNWSYVWKDFFIWIAKRKIMLNDFSEKEAIDLLNQKLFSYSPTWINIIEFLYNDYSETIETEAEIIRKQQIDREIRTLTSPRFWNAECVAPE